MTRHRPSCLPFSDVDFQGRDETLGDLDLAKHGHDTLGSDDTGLLSSAVAPLGFPPSDSLFMEDGYVGVHSDAFGHVPSSGLLRANELGLATNQQSAPYVAYPFTLPPASGILVRTMHGARYLVTIWPSQVSDGATGRLSFSRPQVANVLACLPSEREARRFNRK